MKKLFSWSLIFLLTCVPLLAQKSVESGYHVSFEVTPQKLGTKKLNGAYHAIGGFDLNNNGKGEFIFITDPSLSGGPGVNRTDGYTVYYMESTGNDNYEVRWSFITDSNRTQRSYPYLALADIDKDGRPELFVSVPLEATAADPNPVRLFIFEWDPVLKNFPTTPSATWNYGVRNNFLYLPTTIEVNDVDGDGDRELITASRRDDFGGLQSGRTLIASNIGSSDIGGLVVFEREFMDSSAVLKGGAVYDMKVVDFDGDGKKEIWVFTWDMYSLAIYEATGPNTYTLQADINRAKDPDDIGSRHSMQFVDVNKDGKLEMYSFGTSGDGEPRTAIYYIGSINDVSKLTKDSVKTLGGDFTNLESSTTGDPDGDGKMDFIFTTGTAERQVYHLEYKGTGALNNIASYDLRVLYKDSTTLGDYRVPVIVSDMDGDRKQEILITNLDVADSTKPLVVVLESDIATSVDRVAEAVPTSFRLSQNYPNPFNPSTFIEFSVPKTEIVTIKVYDVLGRELETLLSELYEPGTYKIKFKPKDFSSGVYLYTIKAGGFFDAKKMTLLK